MAQLEHKSAMKRQRVNPAIITNISNQVSTLGQYALASLLHVGGGIFIISGDLQ